jgi:hypothetical protein
MFQASDIWRCLNLAKIFNTFVYTAYRPQKVTIENQDIFARVPCMQAALHKSDSGNLPHFQRRDVINNRQKVLLEAYMNERR